MPTTIPTVAYDGTTPDPVEWANDSVRPAIQELQTGVPPIDLTPLNATYGDEFAASSLNARWTRVNVVAGDESYQQGTNGSAMVTNIGGGSIVKGYTQSIPAGDFDAVASIRIWCETDGTMMSFSVVDNSLNGYGFFWYANPPLIGSVSGGDYGGSYTAVGPGDSRGSFTNGQLLHARITRVGTTYTFRHSFDGDVWSPPVTRTGFTPTKFGILRGFAAPNFHYLSLDRFNVL